MDAAAELGRNPVSKHHIEPEYGDEQADAGWDCRTRLARPNFQARTRTGKYSFFLFIQLTTHTCVCVQDWQPYPVDPYSCYMCDYTYISLITPWEDQCEWHIMTRMTGPDCAVMCNLINIHTYIHSLRTINSQIVFNSLSRSSVAKVPMKTEIICQLYLKKDQNAPRPSEHPPVVRGKTCQNV